jgi:beta-lactam-binding protein with PASTA domain
VAAVDKAGNEGPRTATLVGVPNLVGLNILQAPGALGARGLALGTENWVVTPCPGIVVSQTPGAPTVAPAGSSVNVVIGHA